MSRIFEKKADFRLIPLGIFQRSIQSGQKGDCIGTSLSAIMEKP
jgi:hypothetical protein